MSLEPVILTVTILYLRKSLKVKHTMPEWGKRLQWILYASIALIVGQAVADNFRFPLEVISMILLGWLLYVIGTDDKFKTVRFLIIAIAPYLVITFIAEAVKLISIDFYNKWQWDVVQTFAVIWGFGTLIVTRKQRRELIKARAKALAEEENNKVISAMKAELEVQVAERTAELRRQKEELENTLSELRATQTQLIHSEKMASLGELTAGIAHEIQNPLNFVNNFSEVNKELMEELKEEIEKKNYDEVNKIANDVIENEEKITFHGKRADAIVKGMLQHSRTSSGQKELTDINALSDEYLRLAYHGLRAKDKTFNAKFDTDFDPSVGKINIISQDVGRVMLNLINNAFYAVTEKNKQNISGYEPTVKISTKRSDDSILISVKDNGNGIPQRVLDKIFQPFFTTKPTGEGTGLGLSLSYDIIMAHGGEIKVETKEGEGTEFIINLPAQ